MTDEPQLHDLTKFILSRLESYPEEFFYDHTGLESMKWAKSLSAIKYCGTAEDKAAINKAHMDFTLQIALKTLLAPEESADSIVGQSSNGFQNASPLTPNHYGNLSAQAAMQAQQAQAMMRHQAQAMLNAQRAQQTNNVTAPPNVARAMGLKPPTARETLAEAHEQIKKRLWL